MWESVSNTELNAALFDIVDRLSVNTSSSRYAVFYTLFHYGFRISALKKCFAWEVDSEGNVVCETLKGNSERRIPFVEFPKVIQDSILDSTDYLFTISYDTYERYFNNHSGFMDLRVGNKSIGSHAFRHNRMKQMSLAGSTNEDIRSYFGLASTTTVQGYVNSVIEKRISF